MTKKIAILIWVTVITITACQKTSNTPNNNPPPTDTTKPEQKDTAYLLKSLFGYTYNQDGTTIIDSFLITWTYDSKRRPLLKVIGNYITPLKDTVNYSYSANQSSSHEVTYLNGILFTDVTQTVYLNSSGDPDSSIGNYMNLEVSNGVQTRRYRTDVYFYFYNSSGLDTLESGYTLVDNTITQTRAKRLTYKGTELDSVLLYWDDSLATLADIYLYRSGDLMKSILYSNNAALGTQEYTYDNAASGGLAVYSEIPHLVKTQIVNFPPTPAYTITSDYTFDDVNRVKTWTMKQDGVLREKYFCTYY